MEGGYTFALSNEVTRTRPLPEPSEMPHFNCGQLRYFADIAPRRILLITGEHPHSRYCIDTIHEQAAGHSELVVVPGARHIDLCDRTDLIPFDKLAAFFTANLG